jgi:hypothetical protein
MASKVVANFVEACDRYAIHRRLKLESAQLYPVSPKRKKFLHDWISAEIHSCPGRWCNILGDSLLDKTLHRVGTDISHQNSSER